MLKLFLILILLSISLLSNEKKIIYFTPLPMKKTKKDIEDFLPLTNYLQDNLHVSIKYNYKADYADILKGFKNQTIDMAFLGPLPYAILKSEYPYIKPIVSFKQKNGSVHYRCVLSKFSEDIIDTKKPLKIALTQPLSTCGYFMSEKLLKDKFNIELKKQKYKYTMSHTNAVSGALKGEFDIAGSTENIAKKYENLGMIIIAKSDFLPGFSIVVNTKTLTENQINKITKLLLDIPKQDFKQCGSKLKYGLKKADIASYENIKIDDAIPMIGNMP